MRTTIGHDGPSPSPLVDQPRRHPLTIGALVGVAISLVGILSTFVWVSRQPNSGDPDDNGESIAAAMFAAGSIVLGLTVGLTVGVAVAVRRRRARR